MYNNKKLCATTDTKLRWEEIDFQKAEKRVKKLQRRIAEAYRNQRYDVMMYLQNTLIHSFSAKALAVKRITSNKGKKTPGIDGVIWNTSESKIDAIYSLNRRGYKSNTLKRIYIPKPNGGLRPLSIPTMQDRAMQTLYKFAFEPIAEVNADIHSYGFRPNRCVNDAIQYCKGILEKDADVKWLLKIDIKSCFDKISHNWLMENTLMDKKILQMFLKSPYMFGTKLYPTIYGVPQGGTISSILCNITLDGLECLLVEKYETNIYMIRYADDILLLGKEPQFLVQYVVPTIKKFLTERNLELADEKTKLVHICQGITFLGWTIYRENNEIISVPSSTKIDFLKQKIKEVLQSDKYDSDKERFIQIRKRVRGWLNFYAKLSKISVLYDVADEIFYMVNSLGYDNIAEIIRQIYLKCLNDIKEKERRVANE